MKARNSDLFLGLDMWTIDATFAGSVSNWPLPMTMPRRTLMHASHVEADSKMRQMVKDEGFNMRALDEIENLRPCCANCNGDMRRFNMFNFLDRVGRFMTAEYRAWKAWFDSL